MRRMKEMIKSNEETERKEISNEENKGMEISNESMKERR